ncbi:unnamed protein product [Allacma fusca]|uniref:Uncharacterized protein n=1 Tax=Allacma fusca TaxID=39272 RepID=A0A8J2L5B2_9HEXA|nr:unnamed protein product [Allacma fusca]
MDSVWKEFHGNCVETTQGILLVHHEVISNRIGFRGLGFFTVTYTFLGTVLSVISTYSVVVMQFQNSS